MKIGGMGYAILRVTAEQLRELHTIPKDVVFEGTLSTSPYIWQNSTYLPGSNWHDEHPFYFRIKHRYLPRVHDHGPLVIFRLQELLKQYKDVAKAEEENKGKPVPEELFGQTWVDDDA